MIIETTVTTAGSGSTIVPDMPVSAQATGDVFVLFAANDGGTNPISVPSWTEIEGPAPNNSSRTSCWYVEHTGTDITAPTVSGTSNDWIVSVSLCRGIDVASIVDQAVRTDNASTTYDHEAATVTTTGTDELLFHIYGLDGGGYPSPSYGYGEKQIARVELVNNLSLNVDVINAPTAGVVPAAAYNTGVSGMVGASNARSSTLYTIAFNTLPGADIEPIANCKPDIIWDYSREPATYNVTALHATLLGKPTSDVSISNVSRLTTYSPDLTWYGGYTQYLVSTPASLSVQILCKDIPSTDMSVYPYSITFGNSQTFRHSDDGALFYFRDSSGNWALWQPITKDQLGNGVLRTVIGKMSDQTFVDSGGTIDWSDIVVTGSGQDIVSASVSTQRWFIACEAVMTPAVVTGGNAENPATPKLIADSFATGVSIYRKRSQGSGQNLFAASVELGNLTTKTHFIASLDSSAYPENNSDILIGYKCGEGSHSYIVKASANDTHDFRPWILRSSDKQSFVIDPASSTDATYLTDTWIVSGYDVTWKTGIPCNGVSFVGCGIIDAKGASFVGGRVIDSISTTHAMTATDGATIGYDFTKGAETYAIELSSVGGTYDLSQATFDGYTTELNITAATGTTTINLSSGQAEPTYDTAGATVSFIGVDVTVSATNLLDNSQVRLYNVTQSVEVDASVVSGGSGYSITLTGAVDFTGGDSFVLLATYQEAGVAKRVFRSAFVLNDSDITISDTQVDWAEPNVLGIDGSAVTECATDFVEVQVEVDDATDDTQKSRIAAFLVDAISTEEGLRNWVALDGTSVISYQSAGQATIDADVAIVTVINNKAASKLTVIDSFILGWSDGINRADAVLGSSIVWISPDEVVLSTPEFDPEVSILENGKTYANEMRVWNSALAGKSIKSSGTEIFRDVADTKNRITALTDEFGQRISVTTDGT